ncbi:MAG TPA: nuclear transport factor 2 family protein [Pyrinomonadaceae bacterium]
MDLPTSPAPSERSEALAALQMLAETIKRAYAENDVALYASAFDEDAIVSIPGSPPVKGIESLKAVFQNRPELPPGASFEVVPLEVEVISSEWAYAFGTDTLEFNPSSAAEKVKETMTFLVLIRKTLDGWKTFREVISPDQ